MSHHDAKGPRVHLVPAGDDKPRLVCPECDFVYYQNPKIVAGAVVTLGERFLLCKRRIEPRAGFWTLPAGFLELGESPAEGAAREAWEEARADIAIDALLAIYTIKHISQVQFFYRAHLVSDAIEAGPESLEVGLFTRDEIPWDDLAFPTVRWALGHYEEVRGQAAFAPFQNPSGEEGEVRSG